MDTLQELFAIPAFQALLVAGLALVSQLFLKRFIGNIIARIVHSHHYKNTHEEYQRRRTLESIFGTFSAVIIWIITVFWILAILSVNIGALLTGAGLVGIVLGFGAQSVIKDMLAGIFIITENQFRIGDIITVGGVSGVVEGVSIRLTRLRDLDGTLHFVPNGEITVVSNSSFEYSNVNVDIGVSYDANLDIIKETINDVGAKLARDTDWKKRIIEPIQFLRIDSFGESSVTIKALGKVTPGDQWDVAGEFRRRLKVAFDKHHVERPYPQRVVHEVK